MIQSHNLRKDEVLKRRRNDMTHMISYAIRFHDRHKEDDPELATVIYSTNGVEGPWFDIVTGNPEWCEEVLDALQYRASDKVRKLSEAGYNLIEAERSGSLIPWSEAVAKWQSIIDS